MTTRSLPISAARLLVLLACAAVGFAACNNNVGSLFNFRRGGGPTGPNDATGVALIDALGKLVDNRPRVEDAFPRSGGWPTVVPIVIVFSESIARDSVEPPATGQGAPEPARIFLRAEGNAQALPVAIDYLMGDTVVLLRPAAALPEGTTFEVVVGPDITDYDGVSKGGAEQVVTTFRADQAATFEDGRIVATVPLANAGEVYRESEFLVVFDRPADTASVTAANFKLHDGTIDVDATIDTPVRTQGVADPRIFRIRPRNRLAGGLRHEFIVDATITFSGAAGVLDFGNKTPFARFDTVAFARPTRIALGNSTAGFPDQLNAQNFANAVVDVDVDASATAGSKVELRVYGLEPRTQAVGDITFFDTSITLVADGPTTVSLPIGSALGTATDLRFEEGPVVYVARVVSGSRRSSFQSSADGNTDPKFDVTPPTADTFLPPVASGANDVVTDQDFLVLYGRASERLGAAELTDGTATVALWAANNSNEFMLRPIAAPRSPNPRSLTLNLTDRVGNMSAQALALRLFRRGFATGSFTGTLTVEVYDDATLEPVAGATVIADPGHPQKPAAAGRVVLTTGVDGRASFVGLPGPRTSITVVAPNHHLTTLLDTAAAFVSLPVAPEGTATSATFSGTIAFSPLAGQSARVGINLLEDPLQLEVATTLGAPTAIPATAIRPGRPLLVTAFTGAFEPQTIPAFVGSACGVCGPTGTVATPALPPSAVGAELEGTFAAISSPLTTGGLTGQYAVDFGLAPGFGTVAGSVRVRPVLTLAGFAGGSILGAGIATAAGGKQFSINANWPLTAITAVGPLGPVMWIQARAEDADGNLSIHRALLSNATFGFVFGTGDPLGVPTISVPTGPVTGAPAITFADRLNALLLPGGSGFHTIRLEDGAGRRWRIITQDFDDLGGQRTVQVPVLTGVGAGLGLGDWKVVVSTELMFGAGVGDGEFSFEERYRQLVKASRTAVTTFTVQ